MPEETSSINIPGDQLSPDDFEVDSEGNVLVKNKKIAEMLKKSVIKPESEIKPTGISISIGIPS